MGEVKTQVMLIREYADITEYLFHVEDGNKANTYEIKCQENSEGNSHLNPIEANLADFQIGTNSSTLTGQEILKLFNRTMTEKETS